MFDSLPEIVQPHHFQPTDGHHFVEICQVESDDPQAASTVSYEHGILTDDEISEWLYRPVMTLSSPFQDSLAYWSSAHRKIRHRRTCRGNFEYCNVSQENQAEFCPGLLINFSRMSRERRDPGLSIEPFPFSKRSYDSVVKSFRFPHTFLALVAHNTSIVTAYDLPDGSHGLLVNLSSHGFVVTHDPQARRTVCFVIGLCQHQISCCKRELKEHASQAIHPMLFPAIWIDVFSETRVRRSQGRVVGIFDIQLYTGMHWSVELTEEKLKELDFNKLIYELTVLGIELNWDWFALGFLADVQEKLMVTDQFSSACKELVGRLRTARDLLVSLKERTQSCIQQIDVQRQSVYNLINQRDNRTATETAEAIRRIAEAQQAENVIMRMIAEDSNQVAMLTRRDSADMRIIAAVTLICLPATFTATFFSTGFFDFSVAPGQSNKIVSKWIWLYGTVTIILTVAVFVGWYFMARRTKLDFRGAYRQHPPTPDDRSKIAEKMQAQNRKSFLPVHGTCISNPLPALTNSVLDGSWSSHTRGNSSLSIQNSSDSAPCGSVRDKSMDVRVATRNTAFPASKIIKKGVKDDEIACPCCARPL